MAPRSAAPGWQARLERRLPALVGVWLVGVAVLALRLAAGLVEVRGLTRRGVEPLGVETRAALDRLVERSGVRRAVEALASVRVEVPTVVGWLRPTILIPATKLARLSARQVEAILAHELAHIHRFDYVVNLGQVVVEALLFFHPAVWWISRRVRVEREHCCDDAAVVLCGGDRLLVARALFELEEARRVATLGVAATGGSLAGRVRRLVAPAATDPRKLGAGWVGAALVAATLAVVGAALQGGATRAQEPVTPIQGRVLDAKGNPVARGRDPALPQGERVVEA